MAQSEDYRSVTTVAGIQEYIGDAKVIAFDYETAPDIPFREEDKAALDPAKSHIVGCSYSVEEGTAIYVPIAHLCGENVDTAEFWKFQEQLLMNPEVTKVAHNLSFEAMMSYHLGIVIQPPVYDTIAACQLTMKSKWEFRKLSDSGLKRMATEQFGVEMPSFTDVTAGRHFDEMNPQEWETVRYGCADSDMTLRLYNKCNNWFDRFLPQHRTLVEEIESPTAVFLGLMKHNGVPVNRELMEERKVEAEEKIAEIKAEIEAMCPGVAIGSNCSTNAFKMYLYKTLGLPVVKTTETNREAADDQAMQMLKEWCDENRPELSHLFELVQEYRKWGKLKSTYIDGYLKYINSVTGRIHPDFFSLSTDTGRMNCRNPNIQNCFDSETEILTRCGFVPFPALQYGEDVAQWDGGEISFVTPTRYIDKPYDGDMVQVESKHISLLMTPDHRCLLQKKDDSFVVVDAIEYPKDARQLNAGEFAFGEKHLTKAEATLLAATQADGYICDGGIEFTFVKARKFRRLMQAIKETGAPHSDYTKRDGRVNVRLLKSDFSKWIIDLLGPEKKWGPWLLDFDRETAQNILSELMEWDGCFTRQNYYSTSVKENADWMQILYSLTGTRAHLREYYSSNPNAKVNYQLDVTKQNYSLTQGAEINTVHYEGRVYCVTVPSGYIVVRRRGQVCITGNCPRATNDPIGVRSFIKASEGCKLISNDFSQIELRVGAFYCRDEKMLWTYRNGGDIHAQTTSVIFGVTYEQAEDKHFPGYKEHRTIAKNVNFGTFYGLFPRGLQKTLKFKAGVDRSFEECAEIISNLKAGYPGLTKWQEETKEHAGRVCYAETWMGRRRYLPNILSEDWGKKSFAERCALNTPIQGTAADILKAACARIIKGLPERPWLQPILQIHDELVFIVPEDKVQEAEAFVKECMEVQPYPDFDVPIVSEGSVGSDFGHMEEME